MKTIRSFIDKCSALGTFTRPAGSAIAVMALVAACSATGDNNTEKTGEAAAAILTGSNFQSSDGNLVVDGPPAQGTLDWVNAPNRVVQADLPTGSTDNSFGASKEDDPDAPKIVTGSIPNNKSDLTRFYVAKEKAGGKDFLYLAWERANTLGSANMDFEFNQSSTLSSNGVTPVRTANDILITFDFAQGGNTVNLGLLRWVTSGPTNQCFSSSKLPCWGNRVNLSAAGFADGAVNDGFTVVDSITPPSPAPGTLQSNTFGEAGINLTDSGVFPPDKCVHFGKAYLKSRSSSSFPAELKDFISPADVNIDNCQPATIKLLKLDEKQQPLPGAVMQLFKDDGDGVLDSGDTQIGTNCTTPADGTCSFTVSVNGTYIGHELTAPNGYNTAPDQKTTVTLGNAPQTITLTFNDSPLPGTINIHKQDDTGVALSGAVFTLLPDKPTVGGQPGAEDTPAIGTCTSNNAGNCSFTNVPLGEYWVVETTAPSGVLPATPPYQHVTIGLGSQPGQGQTVNLTYINPRKAFHAIVIVCQTDNNALTPSNVSLSPDAAVLSINAAQATALGLDPTKLCQISQAKFGGKRIGANTGTYSINIPQ